MRTAETNSLSIPKNYEIFTFPQKSTVEGIFSKELRHKQIEGSLENATTTGECNFIENRFVNFSGRRTKFRHSDFRDNIIILSEFENSDLSHIGFSTNMVHKTKFKDCKFNDTTMQECSFQETIFIDCDLTYLVVKNCNFFECEFVNCKTNNKLLEMCFIDRTKFIDTEIQIQTIKENFGIIQKNTSSCIRNNRSDQNFIYMDLEELKLELKNETNPLWRLSLYYYISENLLSGSTHLDAALNVEFWIRNQTTLNSFSTSLSKLSEFLITLYRRGDIACLPLLKMQEITEKLSYACCNENFLTQTMFSINGVYLGLTREVENFFVLIDKIHQSDFHRWILIVEGGHSKEFYFKYFPEIFKKEEIKILSLKPHNSPWEMMVELIQPATLGGLFTMILSTRTSVELRKIESQINLYLDAQESRLVKKNIPIASFSLGGAGLSPATTVIHFAGKIKSDLLLDVRFSISTEVIGKVRSVLYNLLKPSPKRSRKASTRRSVSVSNQKKD